MSFWCHKEIDVSNTPDETYRLTIRAPSRIGKWLEERAKERGISKNAQIITVLEAKMEAEKAAP